MNLGFDENEICKWAEKYKKANPTEYEIEETEFIAIESKVQQRGYLDKEELYRVACWLKLRRRDLVKTNNEDYVKEITGQAFTAKDERSRIEVLTQIRLKGIGWSTASAILHLFHKYPYPILSGPALWSVGEVQPSQHSFSFWWCYVRFCRDVACRNQVDMRTLDRALWQYAKCKKPKCKQ